METHIILCDGATLTCTGGILVEDAHNSAQLFIYGQTNDTGKLIVTNCYWYAAGIGSSGYQDCGEINIHGGNLDITGGKSAAGIGGGTHRASGTTKIYGGKVKAQGGDRGAGIGGGSTGGCGTFHLYGGEVTATGGYLAAGVGGGGNIDGSYGKPGGSGGSVHVYGGKLTAQGGKEAAGIGSGPLANYDNIVGELYVYNEGATVIATGGKYGAGTGGGMQSVGIKTYIYAGEVTAKGGVDAAGIGSGEFGISADPHSCSCETHISGGTVRAEGSSYGAGIGGGEYGSGGDVHITGGTVIVIAGEDSKGRDDKGGSAIGCGQGYSGKDADNLAHVLEFGSNMRVTGGDAENNIECVFGSGVRVPACRWRNFVKIEPCSHETPTVGSDQNQAITYSIDDELRHTKHCRYCKYTLQEEHTTENCVCGVKDGTYQFTVYEPGTAKNSYVQGTTKTVGAGKKFYLPECTNVPAGYIFKGWEMNPETTNRWAAVKGGDSSSDVNMPAGTSVEALLGQEPASFYARFIYDIGWETIWDYDNPTTGTMVSVTHTDPDFPLAMLRAGSKNLTITSEPLTDGNNQEFGTHYVARATYILNGYEYTYDNVKDVLSLSDNADNSTHLAAVHSHTADITFAGRTLYKDGKWNTICLPFNVTLSDSPLAGADVRELDNANLTDGVLTLNFTAENGITKLVAGTPYIIKWASGEKIVNPVFTGVTVKSRLNDFESSDGKVVFKGNYNAQTFSSTDKSILFMGDGNKLYYPQNGASIGACRAYFQVDLTGGQQARQFVLNFGDDTTSLSEELRVKSEEFAPAEGWYTLDGRKVNVQWSMFNGQLKKGVYIHSGKKVVIK